MGNNMTYHFGSIEDTYRANILTEFGAKGDGIADDTAAINNALASGAPQVFFPSGTYKIDGYVVSNITEQVLVFDVGAILSINTTTFGSLTLNGDRSRITGDLVIQINSTSSNIYTIIDLHGNTCSCDRIKFNINNDNINITLMKLSGNFSQVGPQIYSGTGGSFKYGLELARQDGYSVSFPRSGLMVWQMGDDGITTRNFSALLRMQCNSGQCGPISLDASGRHHFINGIVEVVGQHNSLLDPQIRTSNSTNGILLRDDAEFLNIYDGELVGNYLSGSVGILCGDNTDEVNPATGQLKCYGTKIRNWEIGVRITGSSDTPQFHGGAIANNKLAQVQIDSHRTAGDWPVSGLGFFGVYSECVAFACPFLHLKSGVLAAGVISSCYFGIVDTAILVEAGMGSNGMELLGNRFAASGPTDAVTTPNALSQFFFGFNGFNGTNLISKGANASKATSINDQVSNTLKTNTSLTIGSTGTAITLRAATFFTANFSSGIAANDQVELTFSFSAAGTNDYLSWSINGPLAANTSLLFFAYISSAGNVTLRARNLTGTPVEAVSGTFLVQIFRGF